MPRTEGRFADLVGVSELCRRWGVSRARASQLTNHEQFPKPVHRLTMGPMWHLDDIREWEALTGRAADEESR